MKKLFRNYGFVNTVYDNEGAGAGAGDGTGDGTGTGEPPVAPPAPPIVPPATRTYSQEEYERAINAEKKKAQEQTKETIKSLEKLRESQSITEQEKSRLTTQIEDLNKTLLSKEELAKRDKEKLVNEHKATLENVSKERDAWRIRFEESQIVRAITDAAIEGEAFNPKLIVPLLRNNASLVEGTGSDGKPNGVFSVKIKLSDVDANGVEQSLVFSPTDAIKVMKDRPTEYGQLFKGMASGGVGGGASPGNLAKLDPSKMTQEEFMAHREQLTGRNKKR